MLSFWNKLARPDIIAGHYRGIILTAVLINTTLIVFLVVFIWTYGLELRGTRQIAGQGFPGGRETLLPVEMTVQAERIIVWSKPGGVDKGAASRGILDQGEKVQVLDRVEFEGAIWLEVALEGRRGWVPAAGIK